MFLLVELCSSAADQLARGDCMIGQGWRYCDDHDVMVRLLKAALDDAAIYSWILQMQLLISKESEWTA